jgi:putative N-acetylmannosamine-6-phosphate epimerase
MDNLQTRVEEIKRRVSGGLIVSCQAHSSLPIGRPGFIAAMAETAQMFGAVGVRIESPENIAAVRPLVSVPIFGLYKISDSATEVYITPTFLSAKQVAEAGSDAVAIDATMRSRANGERIQDICRMIKEEIGLPILADVSNFDEGVRAAEEFGCEFISTTLSGYTRDSGPTPTDPDFATVEKLSKRLTVPVFAEGRLASPSHIRRAFESGAFACVVGSAITGLDHLVKEFVAACGNRKAQS